MTIEDPVVSTQLLLRTPAIKYDTKVPFKHWQLRSLLCTPSSNFLYYPSENRIYGLDTSTKRRRLVATLPFSPRCIGAKYGWVCVGGHDYGQVAVIRVGSNGTREAIHIAHTPRRRLNRMVDDDMDSNEARGGFGDSRPNWERAGILPGATSYVTKELGGLIVNSVTMHRPPDSENDDDVVAVLTNNDRTVRILHLAEARVICTLKGDTATNHASISPDGKFLVAVGDAPRVYFYQPIAQPSLGSCIDRDYGSWTMALRRPLTAGSDKDALMSTSFSPSSEFCAVASQSGLITIFNTQYLNHEWKTPVQKVLKSSRFGTDVGAVRSVQFSPGPWDLLIWAEHEGRVVLADTRSDYTSRQIVDVQVSKESVVEAHVEEENPPVPSAWDISQSLIANPPSTTGPLSETTDSLPTLTDLILESSRSASSSSSSSSHTPTSDSSLGHLPDIFFHYDTQPNPTLLRSVRARLLDQEFRHLYDRQPNLHPLSSHQPALPRRRNSVHPSYEFSESVRSSNAASRSDGSRAPIHVLLERAQQTTDPMERAQLQAEMIRESQREIFEQDRLRGGASMSRYRGPVYEVRGGGLSRMAGAGRRNVGDEVDDGWDSMVYGGGSGSGGVDITGCTLSVDGRKLYVATGEGILEYKVDITARKVFPSISMR